MIKDRTKKDQILIQFLISRQMKLLIPLPTKIVICLKMKIVSILPMKILSIISMKIVKLLPRMNMNLKLPSLHHKYLIYFLPLHHLLFHLLDLHLQRKEKNKRRQHSYWISHGNQRWCRSITHLNRDRPEAFLISGKSNISVICIIIIIIAVKDHRGYYVDFYRLVDTSYPSLVPISIHGQGARPCSWECIGTLQHHNCSREGVPVHLLTICPVMKEESANNIPILPLEPPRKSPNSCSFNLPIQNQPCPVN